MHKENHVARKRGRSSLTMCCSESAAVNSVASDQSNFGTPLSPTKKSYREVPITDQAVSASHSNEISPRSCRKPRLGAESTGSAKRVARHTKPDPGRLPATPSSRALPSPGPMTIMERLETMNGSMRIALLAVLLGVGRSTLYDWVEAGTIPCYRHRGVIFFDPVIIARWLRQRATGKAYERPV
jgi:excisionase family DNA binding protein